MVGVADLRFQQLLTSISVTELDDSELDLIRQVQRENFSAELSCVSQSKSLAQRSRLYQLDPIFIDGVLHVGGRFENANLAFDLKHPIILPEGSYLTQLIIEQAHSQFVGHCGVNITLNSLCQRFWILNVKVAVRKVINRCAVCKK